MKFVALAALILAAVSTSRASPGWRSPKRFGLSHMGTNSASADDLASSEGRCVEGKVLP